MFGQLEIYGNIKCFHMIKIPVDELGILMIFLKLDYCKKFRIWKSFRFHEHLAIISFIFPKPL